MIFVDGGRFRASRLALGYVVLTPFLRVLLRYVLGGRVALWTFTLTRMASGTVNAVVIGAIVWVCVSYLPGAVGRLLNSKPMVYIVVLSYSLYLWQQPFLNPARNHWICEFPANILIVFALALCSYHFTERPFLALKQVEWRSCRMTKK